MTVQFGNGKTGTKVLIDSARTSEGGQFPNPGSLAPEEHPLRGGKVMGAAPDHRAVPAWVEFTWIELPYAAARPRTKEELAAVPVQRARIDVGERVPGDVIAEVIRSKQLGKSGEEALHLWLSFVWQRNGIAFGWQQYRGCCTKVREGGDRIE